MHAPVVGVVWGQRLWVVDEGEVSRISPADRAAIKAQLVNLMCTVPDVAQKQLSESLSIISNHDFPDQWPALLPELVAKLTTTDDLSVVNGVLETANSIFKRHVRCGCGA